MIIVHVISLMLNVIDDFQTLFNKFWLGNLHVLLLFGFFLKLRQVHVTESFVKIAVCVQVERAHVLMDMQGDFVKVSK